MRLPLESIQEIIAENFKLTAMVHRMAINQGIPDDRIRADPVGLVDCLPDEDKIELISRFRDALARMSEPTEQMVRLHQLKWKL